MKTIKIGRNQTNDVVVPNNTVSGQHAILTINDDGSIYIKDLNSTNHTYVNGQIVSEAKLKDGDAVRLGGQVFDWKDAMKTPNKTAIHSSLPPITPSDAVDSRTIGRDPMSNIKFAYDDVSSKHALLYKTAKNEVVLLDLNSTNGTYVNGERIARRVLQKGDMVMLSSKYPLQWESVFPQSGRGKIGKNNSLVYSVIAAVAAVVIALIVLKIKPWNRTLSQDEIYAEYKNSVVMIINEYTYSVKCDGSPLSSILDGDTSLDYLYVDGEGEIQKGSVYSCGTGFFVSNDGKIMTNRHVVYCNDKEESDLIANTLISIFSQLGLDMANRITVEYTPINYCIARNDQYFSSLRELTNCVLCRYCEDSKLDVAYLQTNSKHTPDDVTAIIDINKHSTDKDLSIGKEIYTIGFPATFTVGSTSAGLEATCQNGKVTQERGDYEYGHNITILQGASGSPVFDTHGKFAGIIVSGFLGLSQGYNHAIKPDRVMKFYNN